MSVVENKDDLAEFTTGASLARRLAGLAGLIKTKSIHKAVKDPQFVFGLTHLTEIATSSQESESRLLAVAALSRIAAVVKSLRRRIGTALSEALVTHLASPSVLINPDDRYYVARACGMARPAWCIKYLAEMAISEESAEKVRGECLSQLVGMTGNVEEVLGPLRDQLAQLAPETESPGDSAGRRLRRVLTGLRAAISASRVEIRPRAGSLLADTVRSPFRATGRPETELVGRDLADELLALIHELIRARFSLVTETATYEALYVAEDWVSPRRWPAYAKSSAHAQILVTDLREALTILARQGRTDATLLTLLTRAAGSEEAARAATSEIAQQSGLSPEAREWLVYGGHVPRRPIPRRETLAAESQELAENAFLADLLIEAEQLARRGEMVRQEVLPEVRILAPALAVQLEGHVGQGLAISEAIRSLARRRSLEVQGVPGEVIEYSPLEHEIVDGTDAGVRYVRIRKPTVVHVRPDSVPVVVRKALVEAAGRSL